MLYSVAALGHASLAAGSASKQGHAALHLRHDRRAAILACPAWRVHPGCTALEALGP